MPSKGVRSSRYRLIATPLMLGYSPNSRGGSIFLRLCLFILISWRSVCADDLLCMFLLVCFGNDV